MRRARLFTCFLFAAHCSAALAATPVFQLRMHATGLPALLATDPASSGDAVANLRNVFQTELATHSAQVPSTSFATVASEAGDMMDKKNDGYVAPMIFSGNRIGDAVSKNIAANVNNPDDSLYFFLKHFKARSSQEPEYWTILLVALCCVLYQIRRRPQRTAIGFYSAPKPIGSAGLSQFVARSRLLSRKKKTALTQADATSGG